MGTKELTTLKSYQRKDNLQVKNAKKCQKPMFDLIYLVSLR